MKSPAEGLGADGDGGIQDGRVCQGVPNAMDGKRVAGKTGRPPEASHGTAVGALLSALALPKLRRG